LIGGGASLQRQDRLRDSEEIYEFAFELRNYGSTSEGEMYAFLRAWKCFHGLNWEYRISRRSSLSHNAISQSVKIARRGMYEAPEP
jgi:hypothetical protein